MIVQSFFSQDTGYQADAKNKSGLQTNENTVEFAPDIPQTILPGHRHHTFPGTVDLLYIHYATIFLPPVWSF